MKYSILILLTLISCNIKETPKCSDEKVKEKVLKVLREKLKPQLIINYSNDHFELESAPSASAGPNDYLYTNAEYKEAQSYAQRVLNEVKLENIITTNLADSIKKCSCESHIEVKYLGKLNIKYSAELTDDGKPYVKLDQIENE